VIGKSTEETVTAGERKGFVDEVLNGFDHEWHVSIKGNPWRSRD
jgi:hypothetical protein